MFSCRRSPTTGLDIHRGGLVEGTGEIGEVREQEEQTEQKKKKFASNSSLSASNHWPR
jgi:hypothetical protein